MDTIRVRLQTGQHKSISKSFTETLRHEGVRGFFKGIASPVATVGLMNAGLFLAYTSTTNFLLKHDSDAIQGNLITSSLDLLDVQIISKL